MPAPSARAAAPRSGGRPLEALDEDRAPHGVGDQVLLFVGHAAGEAGRTGPGREPLQPRPDRSAARTSAAGSMFAPPSGSAASSASTASSSRTNAAGASLPPLASGTATILRMPERASATPSATVRPSPATFVGRPRLPNVAVDLEADVVDAISPALVRRLDLCRRRRLRAATAATRDRQQRACSQPESVSPRSHRQRTGTRPVEDRRARSNCEHGWIELPVMPPVAPMLAKPAAAIPPGQFYEPKWDGFRSIVFRDGDEVEIGSRKERPMTRYFPEVVEAVRRNFPPRAVIDGEIVIAGDGGLDFWALQQRIHPAASRVTRLAPRRRPASSPSTCWRSAMTISRASRSRIAAPRSSGRSRTRRRRSTSRRSPATRRSPAPGSTASRAPVSTV